MANYANADGRASFPSVLRLARDTGMCERAVRYNLRKLELVMLIRRGNPAIVASHIKRVGYRPICYDLLMSGAINAPHSDEGGNRKQGEGQLKTLRGASVAPDPPLTSLNSKRFNEVEKRKIIEDLKKKCAIPTPTRKTI